MSDHVTEDLGELVRNLKFALGGFGKLATTMPITDILRTVMDGVGDDAKLVLASLLELRSRSAEVADDHVCEPSPRPVEAAIRRSMAEATSPIPGQTPAIQAAIMFFGGRSIEGVLSETPEGGLRLMSPAEPMTGGPRSHIQMVEQFFGYEDVVIFALRRVLTLEEARIITS